MRLKRRRPKPMLAQADFEGVMNTASALQTNVDRHDLRIIAV